MKSGLYSIHVDLLDGRSGKGSGVVVFREGEILGGDPYLFYTGTYVEQRERHLQGKVTVMQHTRSPT